jgi:hypothetical protein
MLPKLYPLLKRRWAQFINHSRIDGEDKNLGKNHSRLGNEERVSVRIMPGLVTRVRYIQPFPLSEHHVTPVTTGRRTQKCESTDKALWPRTCELGKLNQEVLWSQCYEQGCVPHSQDTPSNKEEKKQNVLMFANSSNTKVSSVYSHLLTRYGKEEERGEKGGIRGGT